SDPLLRQLADFRPNPNAVDRDELLFQAGRASAMTLVNRVATGREENLNDRARWSPHVRRWKHMSALLASLLVLTLIGWGGTDRPSPHTPSIELKRLQALAHTPVVPPFPHSPATPDPDSYVALMHAWNERGELPQPTAPSDSGPQPVPATAGNWR